MKRVLIAMMLLLSIIGQSQEVLELFHRQIDAYNAQDVGSMVDNLHDDFKWYYLGDNELTVDTEGKEAFRKAMTAYYQNFTSVKSEMTNVSVLGNKVSFMETVIYETSSGKSGESKALGMYTFKDGKLFRAYYF